MMDASSAGHPPSPIDPVGGPAVDAATQASQLTSAEVNTLLQRATAADPTNNAIIAVVDRGGRVLGVRVENGRRPGDHRQHREPRLRRRRGPRRGPHRGLLRQRPGPADLADDSGHQPETITQREIESNPSITDPNSTLRGPGFVAPVGTKGHFPPGVPFTPQVDLFAIEHTNRDSNL